MTLPHARVAVITRTKNRPLLLKRAIESVMGQSYQDTLMVIVNDGGNQEEVDSLVSSYHDSSKQIVVLHNEKSLGMEAASNRGITSSDSTYVVIHDDDDSWDPSFLETMIVSLESVIQNHPECAGVVSDFTIINEVITGNEIREVKREDCSHWVQELTLWRMAQGNCFPPIAFLYKRSVLEQVGYYDESLPVLGDWEFNLRFLARYDIHHLTTPLAFYHHRGKDTDAAYGNTVISGVRLHRDMNIRIRNKLLRSDLDAGKLGLGYIVNQNSSQHQHISLLTALNAKLQLLETLYRRLFYPLVSFVSRLSAMVRRPVLKRS